MTTHRVIIPLWVGPTMKWNKAASPRCRKCLEGMPHNVVNGKIIHDKRAWNTNEAYKFA